ncbi:hydroxymethylpyrimidine/phosphomethylpyrimidine kinase, partial [Ralstonia pickettii]|nr:hydroxymethylpyrimidine/phosphomethylpyrimidine kinase [Ralstonia pickettii]
YLPDRFFWARSNEDADTPPAVKVDPVPRTSHRH